jgi:hypothetical protein
MRTHRSVWVALSVFVVQAAPGSAAVIAGSSLASPPPFWTDSFWGLTPTIEQAFPFEVIPGGPYLAEALEVAVHHYEGLAGDTAEFSIHLDEAGLPGTQIATFPLSGISTTQQVLTATPLEVPVLNPGTAYWLVGSTSQGQVNWNLADSVFGPAAYRVAGDDWVVLANTNVSAFAILGSPVPEPSSAILMGGVLVFSAWRGRRLRKRKRG